jgi:hypothetical protein
MPICRTRDMLMTTYKPFVVAASAMLLALPIACGDDESSTTSGTTATTAGTGGTTSTSTATGGSTTSGGGGMGTGGGSSTGGGSTTQCFPLSVPTVALPDGIPDGFTSSTPTWMRPTGEQCPATGLGTESVPFNTYCYENDTGAAAPFLFEIIVDDNTLKPAVVLYDGDSIPSDAQQCAAVSSDLVIDSAEAAYTVPTGGKVTIVTTLQQPGTGTYTVVVSPDP